jgi:hypothetical protein
MARLSEDSSGYGVIFKLPLSNEDPVRLLLFAIDDNQSVVQIVAKESDHPGATPGTIKVGESVSIVDSKFAVVLVSVGDGKFQTDPLSPGGRLDAEALRKRYEKETCCVSCAGISLCATWIEGRCGNCNRSE